MWDNTTLRDDNVAEELVQPGGLGQEADTTMAKEKAYSSSFLIASCK